MSDDGWTKEAVLLAHLAGVKLGPEKFGLPHLSDFEHLEPKTYSLICIVCGLSLGCHDVGEELWDCPPDSRASHEEHTRNRALKQYNE